MMILIITFPDPSDDKVHCLLNKLDVDILKEIRQYSNLFSILNPTCFLF